ncbi:MAG: TonB-dependent receptor [Pseudomonadales bacterium]
MSNNMTPKLLAAIILALAVAAPAGAQAPQQTIEEVVVTATKRETSLMETALSVSSMSQEDLDSAGVKNLLDIGDLVPNLQVAVSPTDSGVQVAVRGLTSNNFTEIGDPTVAMHFDGLYSPRPQAGLALMYDVERVEINRGPQGTLFGRNSTAGSINVISSRPRFDEINGAFGVEAGEFQQVTLKGWMNLPINEQLALRFSLLTEQADSWLNQSVDRYDLDWDANNDGDTDDMEDVKGDGIPNVDQRRAREVGDDEAYGAVDRHAARVSFRYQPSDVIDWNLVFDYFSDQSPGFLSLKDCEKAEDTFFACDHDQWDVATNLPGETDMTIQSIRSIFEWELSDNVILEYRVAFAKQERSQLSDGSVAYPDPDHPAYGIVRRYFDGGADDFVDYGNLVRDPALLVSLGFPDAVIQPWDDLQLETEYSTYESWVHEFQVKSQGDSDLQWIAGLFALSENNEIRFNVENPFCCASVLPLAQSFVQPERTVNSIATFVQFDYAATDLLNFTAGIRYTEDEKQDKNGANYVTTGFNLPNNGLYAPDADPNKDEHQAPFNYIGYAFIGRPNAPALYQSDDLTNAYGTLGADFLQRLESSDNSHKGSGESVTWKVGFDYLLGDNWFIYGYVGTGFKSGGFGDAIDICDCNITTAFDYEPEQNITYELGLKGTLLDSKLNLIASVFYSDNEDLQQTFFAIVTSAGSVIRVPDDYVSEPGRMEMPCADGVGGCVTVDRDIGTLLTANIAKAVNVGLELEFDWYAWEGGRVNGWVAFLDSQIKDFTGATDNWYCLERALLGLDRCAEPDPNNLDDDGNALRTSSYDGNALPWSPKWSLTVNVEHNWYLDGGLRLSPYFSVHAQDEIFFDNSNYDKGPFHSGQPTYATADFAFRVISEVDDWGLEFYVRNITDERVRSWGDRGPGFMRASFAKPRYYGLKFNKYF